MFLEDIVLLRYLKTMAKLFIKIKKKTTHKIL